MYLFRYWRCAGSLLLCGGARFTVLQGVNLNERYIRYGNAGDNELREFSANGAYSNNRASGDNGGSSENGAPEGAAFEGCEMNAPASDDAAAKLSRGERRMRRRALISAPVRVRSVHVIDEY